MAIRKIREVGEFGDSVLRKPCKEVKEIKQLPVYDFLFIKTFVILISGMNDTVMLRLIRLNHDFSWFFSAACPACRLCQKLKSPFPRAVIVLRKTGLSLLRI